MHVRAPRTDHVTGSNRTVDWVNDFTNWSKNKPTKSPQLVWRVIRPVNRKNERIYKNRMRAGLLVNLNLCPLGHQGHEKSPVARPPAWAEIIAPLCGSNGYQVSHVSPITSMEAKGGIRGRSRLAISEAKDMEKSKYVDIVKHIFVRSSFKTVRSGRAEVTEPWLV